jgi:microcompartment protein CcmL/EutN
MDEKETLYAECILGKDAEDFFKSDIGRYVLARSNEEVEEAVEQLKVTPADQVAEIRDLQLTISKAEGAVQWLNEQIIAGNQALQQLENIEDQEE